MRIRLPESERKRARRPGATLVSALLHGVLIALAVNATARVQHAEPAPDAPPVLIYHAPPAPMPREAREAVARTGPSSVPGAPRRTIVPPDLRVSDISLPGPIAVDVALPGTGIAAPTFDANATDGVGRGAAPAAPTGDVPFDARHVERAATPLGEIRPRYPDALRARGADGAVLARYVVDSAGRVRDATVEIVEATDPLLAASVRSALRAARFRPAEVGGRPVAQLVEQRFLFALRGR